MVSFPSSLFICTLWGFASTLFIAQCEELAGGHFALPGLCVLVLPGSPGPVVVPPAIPPCQEQTFLGRRGLSMCGTVYLLSLKELAGWKLGSGWRGPINLTLAEGNNKVTILIYLYAVCMTSCAPCAVRPESWC